MKNYICKRTDAEMAMVMERIKTDGANDYYVKKAMEWLATHNAGKIECGKVAWKQLELVVTNAKGFSELFTVSLDTGSTSTVSGRKRDLLAEKF